MKTELYSLLEFELPRIVDLLNLGFSDYIAHLEFSLISFLNMARTESIDLEASRIIHMDNLPVGVALIARRGWTSRLAAMCLSPEARGRGVGRAAMQLMLEEAASRGERAMALEVIESNTPAVRLYKGVGFRTERRLLSYAGEIAESENASPVGLEEMDIRQVAGWVNRYGLPDLPWQISAESLAQAGPPAQALRLRDACLVISNPDAETISIRSLVVQPEGRGQGQAAQLLRAAAARYPGRRWVVPALCPEEVGGFFERMGLQPSELSQLQMRVEIKDGEPTDSRR